MRTSLRSVTTAALVIVSSGLPAARAADGPPPGTTFTDSGRRLEWRSGNGSVQRVFKTPAETFSEVRQTLDGWVLAGTMDTARGQDLVFRHHGGLTRRLPSPRSAGQDRFRVGPRVLLEAGRMVGAAWLEGDDPQRLGVRVGEFDGNTWTEAETLRRPGVSARTGLAATALADGRWLLVWCDSAGPSDDLVWTVGRGEAWTRPRLLSSPDAVPDIHPALTTLEDGTALLAWSRFVDGDYRLRTRRFDGAGWSDEAPVDSAAGLEPRFVSDSGGVHLTATVAWPRGWASWRVGRQGELLDPRSGLVPTPAGNSHSPAAGSGSLSEVVDKKFVTFGDSITKGGPPFSGGGYDGPLENKLRNRGLNGANVINRGVAGETTAQGLSRIDSVLGNDNPDAVIVMEGTNDIGLVSAGQLSFDTIRFNLDAIHRKIKSRGKTPIAATIIPRSPRSNRDPRNILSTRLILEIRDLAFKAKLAMGDPWSAFLKRSFEEVYYQGSDSTGHPNDEGNRVLGDVFADVILEEDHQHPVQGKLTPTEGPLSKTSTVRLEVYDFGEGVDKSSAVLLINDNPVDTKVTGTKRRSILTHKGSGDSLGCGLTRVGARVLDQAEPPNEFLVLGIAEFEQNNRRRVEGDLTFDCRVDGKDLIAMGRCFGANSNAERYREECDFTGDGKVNGKDLADFAAFFGNS